MARSIFFSRTRVPARTRIELAPGAQGTVQSHDAALCAAVGRADRQMESTSGDAKSSRLISRHRISWRRAVARPGARRDHGGVWSHRFQRRAGRRCVCCGELRRGVPGRRWSVHERGTGPVRRGRIVSDAGGGYGVFVAPPYVLMADTTGGLHDLRFDGSTFTEVGALSSLGWVEDVWYDGTYYYVASPGYGLWVIDVAPDGSLEVPGRRTRRLSPKRVAAGSARTCSICPMAAPGCTRSTTTAYR